MKYLDYDKRIIIEEAAVKKKFPDFRLSGPYHKQYFVGFYTSTIGNRSFRIYVCLSPEYPHQIPELYINPLDLFLKRPDKNHIDRISGGSHEFHTLSNTRGIGVKIRHYSTEDWHTGRTCIAVIIKALLWCEAYQEYLITGKSVDFILKTWLNNQKRCKNNDQTPLSRILSTLSDNYLGHGDTKNSRRTKSFEDYSKQTKMIKKSEGKILSDEERLMKAISSDMRKGNDYREKVGIDLKDKTLRTYFSFEDPDRIMEIALEDLCFV